MNSRAISFESVERNDEQPIRFSMGHKMPSQLSLASNLSSMYEKYSMHLDVIKWTGVVVMLALMSTSLAVTSEMSRRVPTNQTDCKRITIAHKNSDPTMNNTTCKYFEQFDLPGHYKVTVCLFRKQVQVDIRHHKRCGILFSTKQWRYLQRLQSSINSAMKKAGKELRQ
ncbi:unnamed protein product [Mytilus edulis]|uniref:Uncharacterized protein n=1 Tax=Mytilus edulis TaxID=6550 RepID=A0A8S3V9L7_MYTED|nr:unnamed protein product [Mytilus edulis]